MKDANHELIKLLIEHGFTPRCRPDPQIYGGTIPLRVNNLEEFLSQRSLDSGQASYALLTNRRPYEFMFYVGPPGISLGKKLLAQERCPETIDGALRALNAAGIKAFAIPYRDDSYGASISYDIHIIEPLTIQSPAEAARMSLAEIKKEFQQAGIQLPH